MIAFNFSLNSSLIYYHAFLKLRSLYRYLVRKYKLRQKKNQSNNSNMESVKISPSIMSIHIRRGLDVVVEDLDDNRTDTV